MIITVPFREEDLVPMDFKSTWASLEECQRLGLTRSIGVSNFSCKKLTELLAIAKIPPAVNQVEMNPLWQQKKLREFLVPKGHMLVPTLPWGTGTPWSSNRVVDNNVQQDIAQARGKIVVQVALRWVFQQGVIVIVRSLNNERQKENLQILDGSLTEEELQVIDQIPRSRGVLGVEIISDGSPFKTPDDLWDGEM